MNTIKSDDIKIIRGLPPTSKRGDKIAIDSEFFNMQKSKLHRPHGDFAFLGCTFDGEIVYYIDNSEDIQKFFDNIDAGVIIGHNLKFDITQLRRFAHIPQRKLLWDTMLIAQIMRSGYYDGFSLADEARRRLDLYLPKAVRAEFSAKADFLVGSDSNAPSLSQSEIEYSCMDVVATWQVYQHQRAEIDETDLEIWKEIELPTLWTVLSMSGMMIDVQAWKDLYTSNRDAADIIQLKYMENPEILSEISLDVAIKKKKFKGINLGSWMQVGKEIKRQGFNVKSTNEDDISPYAERCEFIRDVLEFRGKSKAASTYGKSWVERGLIESDSRIYSDFKIIGASTGRFSSSSPNVENIPVRETPEFRKCFIAGKGNILVDADWSSQEPRVAAYLSQDEKLIEIFKEKKDVYIEAARLMFGWELDKKDPRRALRMKPTVLGASYGLTEFGMEKKYEVPKEEGKKLLDTFFHTFSGMREWKEKQQKIKTYVETIYGRKFWLNPYSRGSENNALNSPVQGSGGDGIKLAGYYFQDIVNKIQEYKDKIWIINFIHDEILVECDEHLKDWVVSTLKQIMINVAEEMHDGIPADVEINTGYSWHEAHG